MLSQLKSKKFEVAISKANTPKECLEKGIQIFGGISKFINEGDNVFIKFNLTLPGGFPTNTNFDVLKELIRLCKDGGASKISLGAYPLRGIPIQILSDLLNLKEFFNILGAELAFLDNSNFYNKKDIGPEQLKKIKRDSFTDFKINDVDYPIPNVILNSDKLISVNQINVNPLLKLNLSLLNSFSIISPKYQEIELLDTASTDKIPNNQYLNNYISKILDIYSVKPPNLVINDLYYILEGAGPYIYKDSKIRKTNLMIIGEDAVAVDLIALKVLNLNTDDSELIRQAQSRNSDSPHISSVKVIGEKIEENTINVDLCVSKIEDIRLKNFSICSGKYCSGCFKQAYHFINFIKTYMVKDLKYNPNNSFLIGENPKEPEKLGNIIVFGDCAIRSTKYHNFRKLKVATKKSVIEEAKSKILKNSKRKKKSKIKEKPNKDIIELPGCPPDFINCLELLMNYYGKKNLPNLNLLEKINEGWVKGKLNDELKMWEEL